MSNRELFSIADGDSALGEPLTIFILQLIIIVTLSRILAFLFKYLKRMLLILLSLFDDDLSLSNPFYYLIQFVQNEKYMVHRCAFYLFCNSEPPVIAEVVAGILLGPSAFGMLYVVWYCACVCRGALRSALRVLRVCCVVLCVQPGPDAWLFVSLGSRSPSCSVHTWVLMPTFCYMLKFMCILL